VFVCEVALRTRLALRGRSLRRNPKVFGAFEGFGLEQAHQQAEKEVAVFVMQQQRYKMLDADDEEEEDAGRAAAEQRRKEERKKHLRRKREEDVDEDEVCLFLMFV
jgi:hypothetical protein